jgi:hypothetical protein
MDVYPAPDVLKGRLRDGYKGEGSQVPVEPISPIEGKHKRKLKQQQEH